MSSLFGDIFNMVDCLLQFEGLEKWDVETIRYKPESFDVTVVRPRIRFERIDANMPLFKDTMKIEGE